MARILVEVNLQKPLIDQICFPDESGNLVYVSVSYPWLPPHCALCSKWGHKKRDCSTKTSTLPVNGQQNSLDVGQRAAEGEAACVVDQQIVQKIGHELIKDLESLPAYNSTSTPSSVLNSLRIQKGEKQVEKEGLDSEETHIVQQVENTDKWTEVVRKSPLSSPTSQGNKASHGTPEVMNFFNVFSNTDKDELIVDHANPGLVIPEEGELIESETEEDDASLESSCAPEPTIAQSTYIQSKTKTGQVKYRNRSRGPPKPLVNRKEGKLPKHTSSRK